MPHVDREALADDQGGQGIEIDLVHTPIDDQIAHHAEHDQKVGAK